MNDDILGYFEVIRSPKMSITIYGFPTLIKWNRGNNSSYEMQNINLNLLLIGYSITIEIKQDIWNSLITVLVNYLCVQFFN